MQPRLGVNDSVLLCSRPSVPFGVLAPVPWLRLRLPGFSEGCIVFEQQVFFCVSLSLGYSLNRSLQQHLGTWILGPCNLLSIPEALW